MMVKFYNHVLLFKEMKDDFAEYTKCITCNTSLLLCECNCPRCGKRENCHCNLKPINWSQLGY